MSLDCPKSAFIHIGVGKTGSTSIQSALANWAPKVAGLSYPPLGKTKSQNRLPMLYQRMERLPRGLRQRAGSAERLARIRPKMRASWQERVGAAGNIAISCEFLSAFDRSEIAAFRDDLTAGGFGAFGILMYVREPTAHYLSLAQQAIKASDRVPPPQAYATQYREVLQAWEETFEAPAMLRLFDRTNLEGGDVVADFFAALSAFFGCPPPQQNTTAANASLSAEGMVVLQRYRRSVHPDLVNVFRPDSDRVLDLLQDVEANMADRLTKPRLKPAIAATVAHRCLDDIAFVNERLGADWPLPTGTRPEPPPVRDVADILETFDPNLVEELTHRALALAVKRAPKRPAKPTE